MRRHKIRLNFVAKSNEAYNNKTAEVELLVMVKGYFEIILVDSSFLR